LDKFWWTKQWCNYFCFWFWWTNVRIWNY